MNQEGPSSGFAYDATGRRMQDNLPNVECWAYTYDGDRVLEDNCLGGLHARNRYTPEDGSFFAPPLSLNKCCLSQVRYPIYDGMGTVTGLVGGAGARQDSYAFDTFGRPLAGNTATLQPARYGGAWGYRTDSGSTGLIQMGARFHWPEVGRFIQQDPLGEGVNWYAYADNNPVTYVDPNGHGLAGAIVGGVSGFLSGLAGARAQCGTWGQAIFAGVVGATVGGLFGAIDPTEGFLSRNVGAFAGGVIGGAITGGLSGAIGDLAGQHFGGWHPFGPGRRFDRASFIGATLGGAAGGFLGGVPTGAVSAMAAGGLEMGAHAEAFTALGANTIGWGMSSYGGFLGDQFWGDNNR